MEIEQERKLNEFFVASKVEDMLEDVERKKSDLRSFTVIYTRNDELYWDTTSSLSDLIANFERVKYLEFQRLEREEDASQV